MIRQSALAALEDRVGAALGTGSSQGLDVIGYGEISTVLKLEGTNGPVAAKRLPAMTPAVLDRYRVALDMYLLALSERGVTPAPTELFTVGSVPYCVQPLYPTLLVDELRTATAALVTSRLQQLVAHITAAAGRGLGFDGQVSNWAIVDDELFYIDVTTPLILDGVGNEMIDLNVFIASLPWALRAPVRRFLLDEILSHYYSPRAVLVDAVANLTKERLESAIPQLIGIANRSVDPPLTMAETRRYYRRDALMWEVLQRLRRADRWWQRRIRRRRYPFLLPGTVKR